MKSLASVVVLFLCPLVWSQSIPLDQLAGPDRQVRDRDYGLAFVRPPGWELSGATRWGDQEATLFLKILAEPAVIPAVYFQAYYESFSPAEGIELWLRNEAAQKAVLRVKENGLSDYVNRADSFVARTINGCGALSWTADYTTTDGRKWCELLTHLVSSTGHALFFVKVPAEKLADFRPQYDAWVATGRLIPGTVVPSLNPLILQGRALYQAKQYRQATTAFSDAFKSEPIRATDLVMAARAAALAGDRDLALSWLRRAVAKGWALTNRLKSNSDFESLHETDGWKQLIASLEAREGGRVDTVTDKPLQATLLAILEEDQKYRLQLNDVEKKFGRDSKELRALWRTIEEKDAINLAKVEEILDHRGWVGPETVGREANEALFLVIQHADHPAQVKYLPMMRDAVKKGKAEASSLALLEDRVALGEGRLQIYGSQIHRDNMSGNYVVSPLEDPDHVDERRASVGLEPIAEYVKHWDIVWDLEAFKKQQSERASGRK